MNDWIINQNIKHFKRLLATALDDAGRATITKLLKLEREKLKLEREKLKLEREKDASVVAAADYTKLVQK